MNKIVCLLSLVLIVPINALAQTDIYDSVNVGGIYRKFMTHLPLGYNSAVNYALILGFHGGQQAASSSLGWAAFASQSKLSEKADSSGFIVVYPEGLVINQNRSWNAGDCCPPAMNAATDDVGFVDAMLNRLIDDYPIDTSRIYATGSSNGGMMCYRLACELGHRIAAIAPNACSHMPVNCNPANKMPIISFHSKVDPIVFYTGGLGGNPILASIYFPSQDSVRHIWKNLNSCLSIDTVINGNGNNFDFIKVTDCACNVELHHYATTDGSHSWPGGNPNNNPVSTQISATDLLWSFFQNYTLGCLTTSTKETYNSHTTRVFPNPFTGNLYIKDININEQFELLNSTGQIIWAGRLSNQPDFSYLQGGIYLLKGNGKTFKLIKQ